MDNELQESSLQKQRDELKKQQDKLDQQIAKVNQQKIAEQIDSLSTAAKKREEEEKAERLVLKEIALRRKQREEEERAHAARIAKEFDEQRLHNEELLAAQLAAEKAVREAAEKAKEAQQREQEELHRAEMEQLRRLSEGFNTAVDEDDGTEIVEQLPEIDSCELARQQAQQSVAARAEVKPWNPIRKSKRYADSMTSSQVETMLRSSLGLQIGAMHFDELADTWEAHDLLAATSYVINSVRGLPYSSTGVLWMIENRLESPEVQNALPVPLESPEVVPDGKA